MNTKSEYHIPYPMIETRDNEESQEKLEYKLTDEQKRVLGKAALNLVI